MQPLKGWLCQSNLQMISTRSHAEENKNLLQEAPLRHLVILKRRSRFYSTAPSLSRCVETLMTGHTRALFVVAALDSSICSSSPSTHTCNSYLLLYVNFVLHSLHTSAGPARAPCGQPRPFDGHKCNSAIW